jgi:hypothetical protein
MGSGLVQGGALEMSNVDLSREFIGLITSSTGFQASSRVISVANPASPTEVGSYNTPGGAAGVAVAGSYAYVADGNSGLSIIKIANPAAPIDVGFYDTPGSAFSVAEAGSYA